MAKVEVTLFQAFEIRAEVRQAARVVLERLEGVQTALRGFAQAVEKLPDSARGEARAWVLKLPEELRDYIQSLTT